MGQEYGAMQKVAEFFGKAKKPEEKPSPKKVDTSWHDAMVKQANEAFAKESNAVKKVPGGSPQSPTKTKQKPTVRKRVTVKK